MKNLYNQDGSLCSEAQTLISSKPDDMSIGAWRILLKKFRAELSSEELIEFNRLKVYECIRKWRSANPEKVKKTRSKSRDKNRNFEKERAAAAKWRAENPEKTREINAKWQSKNPKYYAKQYAKNPKRALERNKNWIVNNPEYRKSARYKAAINNYHKQRKAKDPLYRLQCNTRSMGNRVVKQLALGKKPTCTEKWQGCTAEELKTYLESLFLEGMTWENYGEWHIDHIRPVCSFSAEEWEQVNHYTNLQPLWAEDNLKKSDNW